MTARRVASASAVGELVIAASRPRTASGTATTKLRAPAALLAKARRVTVRATAVDAAGNRAVVSRRLTVTDPKVKPKRR